MKTIAWLLPSLLSTAALGGVYVQQRRIVALETQIAAAAPRPAESDEADTAEPASADLALLRARVDGLERALLHARSAAPAGVAPGAAPLPSGSPPAPQIEQLRADVDALLAGEATSTEQGKARLRALLEDAQREQRAEFENRRQARILDRLVETAHLSERQREDLGKVLDAERTQRRATMESARAGQVDFQQLRPALEALRAETDRKAKEILDAEQYAAYEESRTQGRGARGGAPGPGMTSAPSRPRSLNP